MNLNNLFANVQNMTPRLRRLTIISLSMTLIGGVMFFTFHELIKLAFQSQLQVRDEDNFFTKTWKRNPFPIYIGVYLFKIENPDEFANGAKARLKQIGPFVYDLYIDHEITSFNSDQTTVNFWSTQSFYYREDKSVGKLSDKVKVLNFPVYTLANMVRNIVTDLPLSFAISPVAISVVNLFFMMHGEGLIKEITVDELLNGYPFSILNTIETLARPLTWFGVELPDTGMPENKFGFLWTKNFTKGGPFEAYTGQKSTDLLQIVRYKDQRELDYYDEPKCNAINGSEFNNFEFDTSKNKKYYIFSADTCKSYNVIFEKNVWVKGIPAYRFKPHPLLFASPGKNPDNRCYCKTPENEEWCDGIFDLGACMGGAPLAYSFPHFLYCSNAIRNNVENMKPDIDVHQSYMDIEPFMGLPLRGNERLQMNAVLKPIPYLSGFRNIRQSILPMLWLHKSAVIDDDMAWQIGVGVWTLYIIIFIYYICFFGGMGSLIVIGYKLIRKRQQPVELKSVSSNNSNRSTSTEPLQTNYNNFARSIPNKSQEISFVNGQMMHPNYLETSEQIKSNKPTMSTVNQAYYNNLNINTDSKPGSKFAKRQAPKKFVPTMLSPGQQLIHRRPSINTGQFEIQTTGNYDNLQNIQPFKLSQGMDSKMFNSPLTNQRLSYSNTTYHNPQVKQDEFVSMKTVQQPLSSNSHGSNRSLGNNIPAQQQVPSSAKWSTDLFAFANDDRKSNLDEETALNQNFSNINDIILKQNLDSDGITNKKTKQPVERTSWSPPGSIDT